jgi:beta-lactamase class D
MRKLHDEQLPLKPETMKAVKSIMVNETTPAYTLSGKTGWAVRNGNNYGWFVGWLETKGKVYYMAVLVEPRNQEEITDFAIARKAIAMETFRLMGVIE